MKLPRIKRIVALTTGKLIATVASIALAAGVVGGVGVVYGPKLLKEYQSSGVKVGDVGTDDSARDPDSRREGFRLGTLSAGEKVESISVTLMTGGEGDDLSEKVDLHLGLGFPLRLYPLGGESMNPAFAAFPQKSSLKRGENSIKAGESATFEFFVEGDKGQDILQTTPELLKDLTVGDLQVIGVASLGVSDWILEGYRIEVNGELFASNDSVDLQPKLLQESQRDKLAGLVPQKEVLLSEISELEAYIATGLASDADKAELAAKKGELEAGAGEVNELAGRTSGYYPWYLEEDDKFSASRVAVNPVGKLGITVLAGGGEQPGTRNPLYIKAGGKKFQLTSEMDPLTNISQPQEFVISMADLKTSPITRADLENIGIGLIGNEEHFGQIPDRAKVQRLVISADGEQIYDSERKTEDRKALKAYWLVPPVHLDDKGQYVVNEEKSTQTHLWITGMVVPEVSDVVVIPEPVLVPIPDPNLIPPLPASVPDPLPPLPGSGPNPIAPIAGALVPTPIAPIAPIAGGPVPNPTTTFVVPGPNPTTTFVAPGPNPIAALPAPGSNPILPTTTLTGVTTGTFVPSGAVNPLTGLQQGAFLSGTGANQGFTPIRRNTGTGLTPLVFAPQPIATTPSVSNAAQLKLLTQTANFLQPVPATPNPNVVTQPSVKNVGFGDSVSSIVIDGPPTKVTWQVQPGSAGATTISDFKVELWGRLLDKPGRIGLGGGPLATTVTANGNTGEASVGISLPADLTQLTFKGATGVTEQVKKEEILLMYVEPEVTPMVSGATLGSGTAQKGPALPLLANPTTYASHAPHPTLKAFSLKGGPLFPVQKNDWSGNDAESNGANPAGTGKFQLFPGNGPREAWKNVELGKPDLAEPAAVGLLTLVPTDTLSGDRIAPATLGQSPFFDFAAKTSASGDQVCVMYQGFVSYPNAPAGIGGVLRGYRIVGNLGLLSGPTGNEGQVAVVQMMLDLSGDGQWTEPQTFQNRSGHDRATDLIPTEKKPNLREQSAWMRLATSSGFQVTKTAGGGDAVV